MIYIYHAEGTDLHKVGYTRRAHADRRREEWEAGCPYPLTLLGTIRGGRAEEARLHRRLKREGKWVENAAGQEWFRLTEEDVEEILGHRPVPVEDTVVDAAHAIGVKLFKRKLNNVSRRKGLQGVAATILKQFLK